MYSTMQLSTSQNDQISRSSLDNGLQQAAALAAATLFVTAHRAVMNTGFTLRRKGVSTDAFVTFTIGILTTFWTVIVIISGVFLDDCPCCDGYSKCIARLVYAPWILQVLFLFWIFAYVDELRVLRTPVAANSKAPAPTKPEDPHMDAESMIVHGPAYRWAHLNINEINWKGPWKLWRMECSQGSLNWRGSLRAPFLTGLYTVILLTVIPVSAFALKEKFYTLGLLNIVGVILFIVDAAGSNSYSKAPHKYTRDTLRVMLHTRHKEGTSYILPCRYRGFDAVWGPKVENENTALDEEIETFQKEGGYRSGKRAGMDKVLASFFTRCELSKDDILTLANWLYDPNRSNPLCKIECKRQDKAVLIALSTAATLWHAEYVVVMHSEWLDTSLRSKRAMLRSPKGSGFHLDPEIREIGTEPGLAGYQEAVKYIYRLFGVFDEEGISDEALNPKATPPQESVVFSKEVPDTIEEYTAKLWHKCIEEEESVFAALYAFTTYWQADIGNDEGKGRHGFPLEPANEHHGDIVTWHIIWRQAWYQAVIAQLTAMSPVISSAFLSGIFQ